jgi:O-antigen ligase
MNFFARFNRFNWTRFSLTHTFNNCPLPDVQLRLAWISLHWGIGFISFNTALALTPLLIVIAVTWYRRFQQIVHSRINQSFFLFILSSILISVFALHPLESFFGVFNFIPFMIMFAGLVLLLQNPDQLRRLAWLLVICSIPSIILGLGQFYLGWTTFTNFDVARLAIESSETPDRMTSTFKHANLFANYLTIVFALAIGLWIDSYQRDRTPRSPQDDPDRDIAQDLERKATQNLQIRLGFLTSILVSGGICLFLSNSRNGWIAGIFAVLAFAIYCRQHMITATLVGTIGGVYWSAFGPNPVQSWLRLIVPKPIWSRFSGEMFQTQTAELRTEIWKVAIRLTQERPLTGWGLQSFGKIYEAQTGLWLGHPHNLVLMLTVSVGIPIALFFISIIGWMIAKVVLFLCDRKNDGSLKANRLSARDRLIVFTYLTAFGCCMIFQTTDVTIFDPRINFLGWFLLAAILGVTQFEMK